MKTRGGILLGVALSSLAFSSACGGKGGTGQNTVMSLDDAKRINSAVGAAASALTPQTTSSADGRSFQMSGEGPCPGGEGTIRMEGSGTISETGSQSKVTVSFQDCLSEGVKLNGSYTTDLNLTSQGIQTAESNGTLNTSLGICSLDVNVDTMNGTATQTGTLCGFPIDQFT